MGILAKIENLASDASTAAASGVNPIPAAAECKTIQEIPRQAATPDISRQQAFILPLPGGRSVDITHAVAVGFVPRPCQQCPSHSPLEWEDLTGAVRCFGCCPPPLPAMVAQFRIPVTHSKLSDSGEVVASICVGSVTT